MATKVDDIRRYGKLVYDENYRVNRFEEKAGAPFGEIKDGYINAGIYLIPEVLIREIEPNKNVALEKECLVTVL